LRTYEKLKGSRCSPSKFRGKKPALQCKTGLGKTQNREKDPVGKRELKNYRTVRGDQSKRRKEMRVRAISSLDQKECEALGAKKENLQRGTLTGVVKGQLI